MVSLSFEFCHQDNILECLQNQKKIKDSVPSNKEISNRNEQNENVTSSKLPNKFEEFDDYDYDDEDELVNFDTRSIQNLGAECTSRLVNCTISYFSN